LILGVDWSTDEDSDAALAGIAMVRLGHPASKSIMELLAANLLPRHIMPWSIGQLAHENLVRRIKRSQLLYNVLKF
jgi:hypothetical protein